MKQPVAMFLFLFLSLLLLGAPNANAADDHLACLTESKEKFLVWNAKWQPDRADDKATYLIASRELRGSGDTRTAILQLQAVGAARTPSRYISVRDEKTARVLCANLTSVAQDINALTDQEKRRALTEALRTGAQNAAATQEAKTLGFIEYGTRGWMRSDPPAGPVTGICTVLGARYSCREEEKQQYGAELKAIEHELQALPRRR